MDRFFLDNKPESGIVPVEFSDIVQNKRVNNLPPLPPDLGQWNGKYALDCGAAGDGEWILNPSYDPATSGETEQQWVRLRYDRDRRLAETDTALLADNPASLTDAQMATLTAYRADLRDLPSNVSDPADPTWPTISSAIQDKIKTRETS